MLAKLLLYFPNRRNFIVYIRIYKGINILKTIKCKQVCKHTNVGHSLRIFLPFLNFEAAKA